MPGRRSSASSATVRRPSRPPGTWKRPWRGRRTQPLASSAVSWGSTEPPAPKLVVFGMHPRRVSKVLARSRALQALAALRGGTPPQRAAQPAFPAGAAPSAGGSAPRAEADTPWTGGDVPQAEAGATPLSPTARAGGGEAPRTEGEVAAAGGTAPPAVEATQPAMRVIPIWMRVPPESEGAPTPGFVASQTRGKTVCVASAA